MSQTELGKAVKELLQVSADNSLAKLGVNNGFYQNNEVKIPFPPALKKVEDKLKQVGFTNQVNQFTEKLNRSAEDAASGVKEIFKTAITQMTINDALGIIMGNEDAATQYMRKTTTAAITSKVSSVVAKSNEKIKLASYWTPLANKYNTVMMLTGGAQVNTDLTQYVTEKAVEGIFKTMAKEEKVIRTKTSARTTSLLQRVFGGSSTSTSSGSSSGSTATKSGTSTTTSGGKVNSGSSSGSSTSGSGSTVIKKN
jgi:transcriptional regulator with PAS, ATPase and Fis domain